MEKYQKTRIFLNFWKKFFQVNEKLPNFRKLVLNVVKYTNSWRNAKKSRFSWNCEKKISKKTKNFQNLEIFENSSWTSPNMPIHGEMRKNMDFFQFKKTKISRKKTKNFQNFRILKNWFQMSPNMPIRREILKNRIFFNFKENKILREKLEQNFNTHRF